MFSLSSPIRRLQALIAGFVFMLLVSYKLSYSKALFQWQESKRLNNELVKAEQAEERIAYYSNLLSQSNTTTQAFNEERLFENITLFCEKHLISIINFERSLRFKQGNKYTVCINKLECKGKFVELVQLSYYIENQERLGALNEVKFIKRRNIETKQTELICTLSIQNIIDSELN